MAGRPAWGAFILKQARRHASGGFAVTPVGLPDGRFLPTTDPIALRAWGPATPSRCRKTSSVDAQITPDDVGEQVTVAWKCDCLFIIGWISIFVIGWISIFVGYSVTRDAINHSRKL
jgi:hypothetical protein